MYKKILVITDNTRDQINGVVTTFKNIEAPAFLDGYSIVYLTPREFVHVSCPGYSEVKIAFPWSLGKKIKEISPDHIHIATEGPLGLFARLYLDLKHHRYNTSYHTKFPEFMKKIYRIPEFMTWWYLRWFHKHSGIVLTNTQTMVDELKDHGFHGDIKPWTRGVNRDELQPTQAWGHPNPRQLVLYVGRVSKEKNIEAVCELVDTYDVVIAYPVTGPKDIIEQGVSGYMSAKLRDAVELALLIPRDRVTAAGRKWTWEECWIIFKENLVEVNGQIKY